MDIIETKNLSSLKINLDLGIENGKVKTKLKSFSYLNSDSPVSDVYEVAQALMSLQKHSMIEVLKQDNTTLSL